MKSLILLPATAILALLISACSGGGVASDPTSSTSSTAPPAATSTATPAMASSYQSQLSTAVWQRVQAASWYNDGNVDSAGRNLLEVLTSHGPLWQDSDSLALLKAYPSGIPDETLSIAKTYARMTLRSLDEVILDPWLADGIDNYERAVMAAVDERPVSVTALRSAMEDGLFRQTYQIDPKLLTAVRIDAVGSLSPQVLELVQEKSWFNDTMDSYHLSLLGVLNSMLSVDEQIKVLNTDDYFRLPLSTGDIAVVYFGDPSLNAKAQKVASAWMEKIEAFVGPFRPVGLVIDTTPVAGSDACETANGGGTRPGRISLPADFCFQSPVVIHELTHAFVGGRYPTWFTEGVAEVTAYDLTGTQAGYSGGTGTIDLNGNYIVLSPAYDNQAALGAKFLIKLYNLVGANEMSALIKDVAGRSVTGDDLLARIRQMKVDNPQQLDSLIASYFGNTAKSP